MDQKAWSDSYWNEVAAENACIERNSERIEVVSNRMILPRFGSALERVCADEKFVFETSPSFRKAKEYTLLSPMFELSMEKCTLSPGRSQPAALLENASPRRASSKGKTPKTPPSLKGRKRRATEFLDCGCDQGACASFENSPRKRNRRFPRRNSVVIHGRQGLTVSVMQNLIAACGPLPVYTGTCQDGDKVSDVE